MTGITEPTNATDSTAHKNSSPKAIDSQDFGRQMRYEIVLSASVLVLAACTAHCRGDLHAEALSTAKRAVSFLTDEVSTEGGYLWRYSDDLTLREGEGIVTTKTVWVQPPGTPAVGEAFVRLYRATDDQQFLSAARRAAEALRLGQMRSGGWQAMIEFEPDRRKKWAYRTDPPRERARDQSSLDDDKTQSAIRFVVQLDRALNFQDAQVHEMALYALDGLLKKGQLTNGGFPQVWTDQRVEPRPKDAAGDDEDRRQTRASFPDYWSQTYKGHRQYWYRYTLNDNLAPDIIDTLFLAAEVYDSPTYRDAAIGVADSLLLAQMPEPQPAWAQQYSFEMQPIWARKFEPPAITGGESQGVIATLLSVYRRTGDRKYLRPIPRALDYLEASLLPDGRLARFYELKTNRPLYFTKTYELTYDDSDMPTHYSFKVSSRISKLRSEFDDLSKQKGEGGVPDDRRQGPDESRIRHIVDSMDARGAWISQSGLRYHQTPGAVIDMRVAVNNLIQLAEYLDRSESN